jgi:predicted transcriptional regulator
MTEKNSSISQKESSKDSETLLIKFVPSSCNSGGASQEFDEGTAPSATITKEFDDMVDIFTPDRIRIIRSLMGNSEVSIEQLLDQLSLGEKGIADLESLASHGIIEISDGDNAREVSISYDSINIAGELSNAN